jgi:ankyrin repeat protein
MALTRKGPEVDDSDSWYCHCCLQKNSNKADICRTCGRHESWAQEGYQLPLHGKGSRIFRPSQVVNVLPNINQSDEVGWTPLHNAAVQNNIPMVKKLLELYAEVDAKNDKGQTALHLSVLAGSVPIVKALLEYKATVNTYTSYELMSPLHLACEGGYRKIVDMLIDAQADVNVANFMERTPLHLAALSGRADIGSLLLRAGANPYAKDLHGWNARQMAELRGHRDYQELIVRATIKEKMAVIKELPEASWHCQLWTDVTESTQRKRREDLEVQQKWDRTLEEWKVAKERAIRERDGEKELERLKLLEQRRLAKIARDKAREELAAQILGANAALNMAEPSSSAKSSPSKRLHGERPRPPDSLMGIKKNVDTR